MKKSRLSEMFAHKRHEVALRKALVPLEEVMARADTALPAFDFEGALRRCRRATGRPALIAEIKQASPSRGTFVRQDGGAFDPAALATVYAENDVAAISVLTDETFFKGSLEHLRAARAAAWATPVLRKDFICDPYQVYEARSAGADAVLLIMAELGGEQVAEYRDLARALGMAALVEVHTAVELDAALQTGSTLIGINNRDLHDFSVSLDTGLALALSVPDRVVLVAESGIHSAQEVAKLMKGPRPFDAMLVGEALMTAPDVPGRIRELTGR